ncbi:MAG: DUF4846 domain-containing protein [Candidatus Moduliflexus flocculans]|nr:DUF4846 domain-containing protein [Candidatus Moduliflexus flocculans]
MGEGPDDPGGLGAGLRRLRAGGERAGRDPLPGGADHRRDRARRPVRDDDRAALRDAGRIRPDRRGRRVLRRLFAGDLPLKPHGAEVRLYDGRAKGGPRCTRPSSTSISAGATSINARTR